jgi:hypothetical protein
MATVATRARDALSGLTRIGQTPEAGVIGERRFAYDLWGPAVNLASRMESHGVPGAIQVSRRRVSCWAPATTVDLKGIGATGCLAAGRPA